MFIIIRFVSLVAVVAVDSIMCGNDDLVHEMCVYRRRAPEHEFGFYFGFLRGGKVL